MKALLYSTFTALLTVVFLSQVQLASAQCTADSYGLYPSTNFTPNCNGTSQNITTLAWAGEYSRVNVVSGNSYTFSSSIGSDYITIVNDANSVNVAFGTTPVVWTATFSGVVRFWTHTSAACGSSQVFRERNVACVSVPSGDCNNTTSFGSATIATNGTVVQITSCSYAGEYSTISGAVAGQTLRFTSSIAGDIVTIRSGSASGPVLGSGPLPFTLSNTYTGTLYAHWNLPGCGNQSVCRVTTVQCTSCSAPSACTNTSQYGSGTLLINGSVLTFSCVYAGDYSVISGAVAGQTLRFTSTREGDIVTIRSGSSSGPVLGFGPLPFTLSNTYTGTLYAHWNLPGCGNQNVCRNTTVQCTSCSAPPVGPNDNCANATPIACGGTASGYTGGANTDGPGSSCTGASVGPDVWYTIVGNGGNITASLCGSDYDTKIEIYTGSCGSLSCVVDNDDFCGLQSQVNWASANGVTYYIRVHGFSGASGAYTLNVTCSTPACSPPGTPSASTTPTSATVSWAAAAGATSYDYSYGTAGHVCGTGAVNTAATSVNLSSLMPNTTYTFCVRTSTCGGGTPSSYVSGTFTTPPAAPGNDNCANAITVTCSSTTNGTTVGATSDAGLGSCGAGGTPGNGVWYKFTGNGSQATISLCGSSYDTKLHVYGGTCGSLSCVASNDNFCGSQSQVAFNAAAGTTYYILVSGSGTITGTFAMNITCLCGPALGAPWTTTNIGASNGGAIENVCDGTIDVSATNYGSPMSDVQTYAWQTMCGNGYIKAKLENVTNGGWGGIMFRENNAGGSKKIALRSQLTSSVVRDLRATTNGFAQQQQFPRPNTPQWLRLTRNGNVFLGETSIDGVNWDFTFTTTLVLPNCIEVGLFAQSINVNTTTTAVFSNIMGISTTPPVPTLANGGNTGQVETQEVLSLFPNPARDEINVKMEAFYGKNITIAVQNQLGQVMILREIDDVQDATERIELNNMPSGIYTLTLRTAGQAPVSRQFMVGSQRP